jgi:hypothetical protein
VLRRVEARGLIAVFADVSRGNWGGLIEGEISTSLSIGRDESSEGAIAVVVTLAVAFAAVAVEMRCEQRVALCCARAGVCSAGGERSDVAAGADRAEAGVWRGAGGCGGQEGRKVESGVEGGGGGGGGSSQSSGGVSVAALARPGLSHGERQVSHALTGLLRSKGGRRRRREAAGANKRRWTVPGINTVTIASVRELRRCVDDDTVRRRPACCPWALITANIKQPRASRTHSLPALPALPPACAPGQPARPSLASAGD